MIKTLPCKQKITIKTKYASIRDGYYYIHLKND
jgi:hypothetical protein